MSLPFARRLFVAILVFAVGPVTRAQTNPIPFLYPLTPSATAPGGPAFTLTVNGTGFVSGAVVNWNGSARTTTFVNSSQVTATISATDIATAKTALITVTNPAPGGGTSNAVYFQVTYPTTGVTFQDFPIDPGYLVSKVVVGDFNGDGKPDLVTLAAALNALGDYSYSLQILLGNGDGTFQAPATILNIPANVVVNDLGAGDFNGDGKLDLAGSFQDFSMAPYGSAIFTLLGNGDGTFQTRIISDMGTSASKFGSTGPVVGDVNGDGIPDLVRACGGVCVDLGNGDGTFREQFTYSPRSQVFPGTVPAQSVVVGDFHKTGKLDIVGAFNVRAYYLVMLPGNGDGTFGNPSVFYGGAGALESLAAVDFYGDGNLDLAFFYNPSASQFPNFGDLSSMRGNGDGTLQQPLTVGGLPQSFNQTPLVLGDFNGDGHTDLATKNAVVLIGDAAGPVDHHVVLTGSPTLAYAAADFNGDGRLDLVGIDPNQNLHVLLQTPPPPDFKGAVNPTYQSVVTGNTASYEITITAINGFSGEVVFNAAGLPEGATATFWPNTVTGSGSTTLKISTTAGTPTGSYPITLTGISGNLVHAGGVTLSVGPEGTNFADFTGSVQPSFQTVQPGGNTNFNIQIDPLYGFASDVSMSASGLPAGGTAAFSPTVVAGGSGSAVLTVSVPSSTPTGTYRLIITGTGGGRTHGNTVAVNVGPPGMDFTDFTGSITPLARTVTVGGSTTFTVNIQPLYGTGCITLQTLEVPAATGAAYDRTTPICGGPASTVLTITTTPQTPLGTYTITILGLASGGNTHSENITLTVTPL